jgi:hypothetical protein
MKKLTIVENQSLSTEQILHIMQRTPKQHVYQRRAKGGGNWDFVTGTYVKKVLNYCFGWLWDFEIKEHGIEQGTVWVLGRLTIKNTELKPMVVKEQFGRADIKFKKDSKEMLDFGNDLKAAATDALKKCASELGIASDVYGAQEFREIKAEDYIPDNSQSFRKIMESISKLDKEKQKESCQKIIENPPFELTKEMKDELDLIIEL